MEKQLFKGEHPSVIRDNLEGVADRIEEKNYVKPLTEEELLESKNQYFENLISLKNLEGELKEIQEEYKEKMKPLKGVIQTLLGRVKMGVSEEKGNVYTIFDYEKGRAGEYAEDGSLILERSLRPDEKQTTIHSIKQSN